MAIKDMLGRGGVVSREEALKDLFEQFVMPRLRAEEVSVNLALGRVTAGDIISPVDLPEFDRSTMDGFSVRSSDTFGATESLPAYLKIIGDIPMGVLPERGVDRGEAMRIATGGALPPGADAVVMLEHAQSVDPASIEVTKAVAPLENVIQTGDDIKKGDVILPQGHRIRPQDMGALAGVGIMRLLVSVKPRVAIINTGNEIVPADTVPGPGKVRDINSYNLEGLIALAGGVPVKQGIVPDDYRLIRKKLEESLAECGLVLLTGGSSVGAADMTAKVIADLGPPGVIAHGVSIKPGKPLIIGLVKGPEGQAPVFGLPGHPAAVSICFELFVKPVITFLTGAAASPALAGVPPYRTVKAKLARSIASVAGREDYVRVTLEKRDDGLWARPVFGASGLISTLVKAVGTVVVPVNTIGIEAGEDVDVRLF